VGLLANILATKREELSSLYGRNLPPKPERRPVKLGRGPGQTLALITEIKRRSPSAGALSTRLSPAERAASYERAGARMISVLTDSSFFGGKYEDLKSVRQACDLPILCKDFIIDEAQLNAARAFGADAVLLIVRCLEPAALGRLFRAARSRDLVPFVEVASEDEARLALDTGADLIGVNARDLDTLVMDPERAHRVLEILPTNITRVHLSGLRSPEAVAAVAGGPADAALIGEALMRADDPEPLLSSMVARASG
jgi:indole-3-glycerol phosphate synthase